MDRALYCPAPDRLLPEVSRPAIYRVVLRATPAILQAFRVWPKQERELAILFALRANVVRWLVWLAAFFLQPPQKGPGVRLHQAVTLKVRALGQPVPGLAQLCLQLVNLRLRLVQAPLGVGNDRQQLRRLHLNSDLLLKSRY